MSGHTDTGDVVQPMSAEFFVHLIHPQHDAEKMMLIEAVKKRDREWTYACAQMVWDWEHTRIELVQAIRAITGPEMTDGLKELAR